MTPMNKSLLTMTIFVLLLLNNIMPAFSEDKWPACEADNKSEDCEQLLTHKQKTKHEFNNKSFELGLNYIKKHPVPLSFLAPRFFWPLPEKHKENPSASSELEEVMAQLIEAQIQWIKWFREDLQAGLSVPLVTTERLIENNKIITQNLDPMYEMEGLRKMSFTSQLSIKHLSEKSISEIASTVKHLRKSAMLDYPDDWDFGIYQRVTENNVFLQRKYYSLSTESLKTIIRNRAKFMEQLLHQEKWKAYRNIKNDYGGYDTTKNTLLRTMDAMRFYYHIKRQHPHTDFAEHDLFKITVTEEDPLFHLFDVPDWDGKTIQEYPTPCVGCVRYWGSLLPTKTTSEHRVFHSTHLTTALDYVERKAMLDAAISILNRNLTSSMDRDALQTLLAKSWRHLTLVHPFADGNGRTIRLLINALLIAYGAPPPTCDPDCMPYNYPFARFKKDMRSFMEFTEKPLPKSEYPQWLYKTNDPALLESLIGL